MKNTKFYVQAYNGLKNPNNLTPILHELDEDWKEEIKKQTDYCKLVKIDFTYAKFTNLVKEFKVKIESIYKKLPVGEDVFENLWKGFYKKSVVESRKELFPEIQNDIMNHK